MKLGPADLHIVFAALQALVDGDSDLWDLLSEDGLDRAFALLDELRELVEAEEEPGDDWEDEDDDEYEERDGEDDED